MTPTASRIYHAECAKVPGHTEHVLGCILVLAHLRKRKRFLAHEQRVYQALRNMESRHG
ncbi:hypothetical protein RE428_32250 [Marinobacter nanhaiticus D15-8W]|nr:hypothetical protein RE428_32250 [Marinobacter nanhaiticus D15-8W]